MKIVVTAFAILPGAGSEPGVGWNWVSAMLRKGWSVSVLTRARHARLVREKSCHILSTEEISRLEVVSIGSERFQELYVKMPGIIHFYLVYWQFLVYLHLQSSKFKSANFIHVLTYAGVRIPSFAPLVGIPVVWGPVGGGERAPLNLFCRLGLNAFTTEIIRGISNWFVKYNPLLWPSTRFSTRILTLTSETFDILPRSSKARASVMPNLGTEERIEIKLRSPPASGRTFLFAARFLYWKGGEFVLQAFKEYLAVGNTGQLVMIGGGKCNTKWRRLCAQLEIEEFVKWRGWLERDEVQAAMESSDCFIFPSLHDSGGSVVLESIAAGTPVLCLNLGGPGVVATKYGLRPLDVDGLAVGDLVAELAKRMAAPNFGMPVLSGNWHNLYTESWDDLVEMAYAGLAAGVL